MILIGNRKEKLYMERGICGSWLPNSIRSSLMTTCDTCLMVRNSAAGIYTQGPGIMNFCPNFLKERSLILHKFFLSPYSK